VAADPDFALGHYYLSERAGKRAPGGPEDGLAGPVAPRSRPRPGPDGQAGGGVGGGGEDP
jgi:hypothetical protein